MFDLHIRSHNGNKNDGSKKISQEVNCYVEGQPQQSAHQKLLNIMNTFSLAVNMLQECGERAVTVPEITLHSDMHLQALGVAFPKGSIWQRGTAIRALLRHKLKR